ncbi:hypothetical protein BDV09DRAFT_89422 [Aspergillus tetrazonus]
MRALTCRPTSFYARPMSFPVLCINPFQGYFPQEPESYGNELGELPPPVLIWGNLRLEGGEPCLPLQIFLNRFRFRHGFARGGWGNARAIVGLSGLMILASPSGLYHDSSYVGLPMFCRFAKCLFSRRDVDIDVGTGSRTPG